MSWPLVSDFSRMLQNPKVALRDPALRTCRIELNPLGQPKVRSGNFATVFRAYREDGSELALRVFHRQADARREAYLVRNGFLEGSEVNSLVPFHYDEKGIRSASDGKLYPLLTMDWVPGVSLFDWVRDRCREEYREALAIGADVWLYLVRDLAEHGIVHGDLQHGNVLVSPEGHFKLVDYDCLAVPELMGQPNLELGLPPYQHPLRNESTRLFPGLDNFSALVIYVALRALAAAPQLWTLHVADPGYDKLLFRSEDFADPDHSPLYRDLLRSPDPQVRDLAYYLFKLTAYDLESVPPIDEVLLWCNSLEDLLARKDWDTAVQLVQRMGADEPVPAPLKPLVAEAHRRVAARASLEEAMRIGSEWEIQQRYVPELLDDYPAAASLVEEARNAQQAVTVLEALNAARRFEKWDVFRKLWNDNHALLNKRASAKPYRAEMKRLWAADSVIRLVSDPATGDQPIVDAWKYLESLGGHPTAETCRPRVAERAARLESLGRLRQWVERSPAVPTMASDRQLTAAWQQSGLNGSSSAADVAAPCQQAANRLVCLRRLRELSPTCTLAGEKELVQLAAQVPDSYHPDLAPLRRAKQRLSAIANLNTALRKPRSDTAIVSAWKKVVRAKAEPMAPEAVQKRVRLAQRRRPLLAALAAIDVRLSDAEIDEQLFKLWDERLLSSCHDVEGWLPRYHTARERQARLQEVAGAIEAVDKPRIDQLLADPLLQNYPLGDPLTRGIAEVEEKLRQRRITQRQNLIRLAVEGPAREFAEQFDVGLVREIGRDLPHHRLMLRTCAEKALASPSANGLAAAEEGGLRQLSQTVYHACWRWPRPEVATRCRVAICREMPRATAQPDDVETLYRAQIDRRAEDGPEMHHVLVVPPEWEGGIVVIWAEIDLGFESLWMEPVELGRLVPATQPKRRGLFR